MLILMSYVIMAVILILRFLQIGFVFNKAALWLFLAVALMGQFKIQDFKERYKVVILNVIYVIGACIQLYLFFNITVSVFVFIEIVFMALIDIYLHVEIERE